METDVAYRQQRRMTAAASDWLRYRRIHLARELARIIRSSDMTQQEAADHLGMHRSDISRLIHGHYLHRYSVDRLIDCLMRCGYIVTITTGPGEDIMGKGGKHALGKQQERIIEALAQAGDLTTNMLAQKLHMKGESIYEHCKQLQEQKTLRMVGARWSLVGHQATKDPTLESMGRPPAQAIKAKTGGFYG